MTALVAFLALLQDPKPEPALAPLVEIGRRLDAGASVFLKGTAAADAFKPWPVIADDASLRAAMKEAAVARLALLQFELTLVFTKGGKPVGVLGTAVGCDAQDAWLLGLGFVVPPADAPVPERRPEDFKDANAPFGKAARVLADRVKAGDEKAIRIADPDAVVPALRPSVMQAPKALSNACAAVARLDYDDVRVVVDDVDFLAYDAEGRLVGAMEAKLGNIRGELGLTLRRFRPVKK